MDIQVYNLPTLNDGIFAIEQKYCEILSKKRSGEELSIEVLDWLDTANNWLDNSDERN